MSHPNLIQYKIINVNEEKQSDQRSGKQYFKIAQRFIDNDSSFYEYHRQFGGVNVRTDKNIRREYYCINIKMIAYFIEVLENS